MVCQLSSDLDNSQESQFRTFPLVVQWLRIRLPTQGARVRSLVWGDPTRLRVTKPVHHDC